MHQNLEMTVKTKISILLLFIFFFNGFFGYISFINQSIIFFFSSLFISLLVSFFFSRYVIFIPLNRLNEEFSKSILKLNRSHIDQGTKDEFTIINIFLSQIMKDQKDLVLSLLGKTQELNLSVERLLDICHNFSIASNELYQKTNTVASSSEEIFANVQTVSTASEEMTTSIKEISKNTTLADDAVKKAQLNANEANQAIFNLDASSSEIGIIIKEITNIAEQTNLLALNATIEAARAGESGKGFSVVANEVKELAKQAAKASEDITSKIKMVQNDTSKAITIIKNVIESTNEINDIVHTIASSVEEQSATTTEVNRNLSEAASGVNLIVQSVAGISSTTDDFSQKSSIIKSTTSFIHDLTINLQKQLERDYNIAIYNFFENSISAHNKWKARLQKAIDGGEIPDESKAGIDNVCDFGKWIYGEGIKFKGKEEYESLKIKHAEFHKNAAKIISLIKQGKKEIALDELNSGEYKIISEKVIQNIRKLAAII